jgi:hypothetical protein
MPVSLFGLCPTRKGKYLLGALPIAAGNGPMSFFKKHSFSRRSMNLKKYWNQIFDELKSRWPDLTAADLTYIGGDERRLVELVEKRRHISSEEAQRDVQDFLDHLNVRRRLA